jgi:predicted ribosomally synthesized peptide with SipW-like signal peptide
MAPLTAPPSRHGPRTSLRVRVALAAGLVLGISAGLTVASWSDAEVVTTDFTLSRFGIESKVASEGAYAEHATAGAAAAMTMTSATIYPASTATTFEGAVYGQLLVRTTINSVAGTAVVGIPASSGDAGMIAALRQRVVRTTGTCNAAAFGGANPFVVGTATTTRALTVGQEVGVTNSLGAGTASLPGTAIGFCVELSLPTGAATTLQGKAATVTWGVTASS